MSAAAVALILVAAVVHAAWNLLSKQASAAVGGVAFVWMVAASSTAVYAPLAVAAFVVAQPHLGAAQLGFMLGTAVLHTGYFLCLQAGYRAGDLSLVYPLARGTGPMLASVAAVVLFGERPGVVGVLGILLVTAGVIFLGWPNSRATAPAPSPVAVTYGLVTGGLIATYTVWDAHAVAALAVPPLIYMWANDLGRTLLLTPLALREREGIRTLWRRHRWHVVGTGLMSPLSYILVLTALTFSPVSAIAPARELSVLFVVLLGGRLLAEGHMPRRLLAGAAIAGGVVAIALS